MKTPNVIIMPTTDGKYRVMINYIQHGIAYASEEQAKREAAKVLAQNLIVH